MLSLIELSGSPFEIGRTLGRFGAQTAHAHLLQSSSWHSVMKWRGSDAADTMQALTARHFPLVHQELLGLAAGLELPAHDVFLWNCRGDLWSMPPDGCTTVLLPGPDGPRIAHNEDGDPGFAGCCGMGLFTPDDGPPFASFVYPASIPGHTFGVNGHGLAMTVNNLRMRQITLGVPRMVLTRALLNQATLAQAVDLLRNATRAGGFHLSLAQRGRQDLLSVEFGAMRVSAQAIQAPALHANHAVHETMHDVPQVITNSSLNRQRRGDAWLRAVSVQARPDDIDPLFILADQTDTQYPIYRNAPDDSDEENTMATADIHIGADHVSWQVYECPGQAARFSFVDTAPA